MKVSILLPIHDKPPEVIQSVIGAYLGQGADQVVVVFDRASSELKALVTTALCRAFEYPQDSPVPWQYVHLEGRPGWRSPCIAGNAGLAACTGDIVIYNPSDVVQAPGNLDRLREMFHVEQNQVIFGRVTESDPDRCKGTGHAGPVLQGSDCTRPMTFLTAYPRAALNAIGGWDLAFMDGVCYEDDDLAARLWKHGLDFQFNDAFSGVHQSHDRLFDGNNASQGYWTDYRVGLNRSHMVNKHGRESAINVVMGTKPTVLTEPGRVIWKHA
jgi:hypothetical protein